MEVAAKNIGHENEVTKSWLQMDVMKSFVTNTMVKIPNETH